MTQLTRNLLRERIDFLRRYAYGAAPAVVMDTADEVARLERELAELESPHLAACAWCSRGLGVCSCVGDCGTPLCAGEANAYIEGEDCR